MGIRKKTINYELKSYMIYCLITALVLNTFTLVASREVLSYLCMFIEFIPSIIGVMFVYNVWRAFSEERLYVHIIPISKGKIFLDIFLNFLLVYTLIWLTKILFIFIKLDFNYIAANTDVYGVFLEWFISYTNIIIVCLFFTSIILLSKVYGTKRVIIITVVTLTILSNVMPDFSNKFVYNYKSNMSISNISSLRDGETMYEKEYRFLKERGTNVDISSLNIPPIENSLNYGGIIINIPIVLILFLYTLKNINKVNISYEINIKERRSLYEKRWYDKWI